ncbi:P1 family peptidase [Halobellus rarus]|uniref:P1 family peptidase n=1 Tax=Halobellus rarus TaxID=1126237 RepID=A0ABD6CRR8_9EURY
MSEHRARVRELGIDPGRLPTGEGNALTDVPGVAVGHRTVRRGGPDDEPCLRTGVTVIDPAIDRNVYDAPVTGATHVLNGYGKSVGLPQVDELGQIETPIGLTNTLDVWGVADAIAGRVLDREASVTSVNPVVGECNDGVLNDIRGRHVTAAHVSEAFEASSTSNAQEGCVGAGTGTTGFGWKAGIGTASRRVEGHVVGALVLTNTGKPADLRIDGLHVDRYVDGSTEASSAGGSIMMLVGTDAALSSRQLGRVVQRTGLGLGRVGGIAHHGSGDFAIGFANDRGEGFADSALTPLFRATVESTEEAIYNSLTRAETTVGGDGATVEALPLDPVRRAVEARESGSS